MKKCEYMQETKKKPNTCRTHAGDKKKKTKQNKKPPHKKTHPPKLQKTAQMKARKLRVNEVPQKEEIQNLVKEPETFLKVCRHLWS